ncbi:MAG: hypothetical protein ISR69_09140 [Gammaproteobacteria bacterium]|nr:hypothetical protein [Gammaproteobacteria bacterium]
MLFNNHKQNFVAAVLITTVVLAPLSYAKPGGSGGGRGGPPPEAFEACANLSEGNSCSFTGRRDEEVSGICAIPPREESLICAPEGGPPKR